MDMFIVHTMEEIQGLMDAHAAFKATLGEADKEYNSIVGLVREVESIVKQFQIPGGLENPYTTLTALVNDVFWRCGLLKHSDLLHVFDVVYCRTLRRNGAMSGNSFHNVTVHCKRNFANNRVSFFSMISCYRVFATIREIGMNIGYKIP